MRTAGRNPAATRAPTRWAWALGTWLGLMLIAIANGALRELVLAPALGPAPAEMISVALLVLLILLVAALAADRLAGGGASAPWQVGAAWVALAVAFELLFGHFALGASWAELLAAYDLPAGKPWPVILLALLVAPALGRTLRRRVAGTGRRR